MRCPRCRAPNRVGAYFCRECGDALGDVCPACGARLEAEGRFCDQCGAPASRSVVSSALPARFASPVAYTPAHLAERILISRSALEGERKQVTVLFADIKGSMELLAGRDPEEARRLLDPVLELMMEAVHFYEGTVNQVLGDGIMALFGAPLALEDHALRACYAALRMQEKLLRSGPAVGPEAPAPVEIHVGINSGEVLVRTIASDLNMDYTAVGETTHLAARLEQMAEAGAVLCAGATVRLGQGYLRVRSLGPVAIKGLADPVEVFELVGAEPARLRFQVAAARGLSRFVGRLAEYDAIRQARDRAVAGHGQVIALVGEPGVGKSRLFWEFTRSPSASGWLLLETAATSYGRATPYLPVITLLKSYFRVEESDDPATVREKVTGRLRALDAALVPTLPAFLALLGSPAGDPRWQAMEPPERRRYTNDAITRLLLRESQNQPLMLVVEDAHWIDHETQALLDALIDELQTVRLLLLVNHRPELSHRWGSRASFVPLRVGPLPAESAAELVRALLGDHPSLRTLPATLLERSAGNPFFLEESVRTLVETGVLTGDLGAYRLVRDVERIQVPVSVQAMLAARIDRLPPEDKRLLQVTSAIGSEAPLGLIRTVVDEDESVLRGGLARLRDAEFLYERTLYPEPEYAFRHALTYEVAYGGLLHERRKAIHARIVAAIERLYADRLTEQVDRLAHHAQRGEVWEKAALYGRQAGSRAAARSAYREAVAHFEQSRAALDRLPETRERLVQRVELSFAMRNALLPLGEISRDLEQLRVTEAVARTLGDHRRLAWISAYVARDLSLLGHPDQAIECGRRALALAIEVEDPELQVLTNAYLGSAYYASGDFRRAADVLRRTVTSLRGDLVQHRFGLPGPGAMFFRAWLTWSLARLGEFEEGSIRAREAIEVAVATDQPLSLTVAHYTLGFLYQHRADLERAVATLEHSLAMCRRWTLPAWFPNVASSLGYVYALSGRLAEGVELLQEAVDRTAATGNMVRHSSEVAMLGEAQLLSGHLDAADTLARRALELARAHSERGNEAGALRLLGEVERCRVRPDVQVAETRYGEALRLAGECGMRPLAACCHLGLGRLYLRVGHAPGAKEHLGRAVELLGAVGMPFWLTQAEAAWREVR